MLHCRDHQNVLAEIHQQVDWMEDLFFLKNSIGTNTESIYEVKYVT